MPRKIKVVRKDINEPDEFISTSSLVFGYLKSNYRMVASVTGAVVLLVLITIGWYYYRAGKERVARNDLNQAVSLYNMTASAQGDTAADQRYREALAGFTALVENYPDTGSAVEALFYLGESSFQVKEYDKAIDYYTRFLDQSSAGNYLECFALEGLGYCYEEKGDYLKAIEFYKRALEVQSNAVADLLHLAIARCYDAVHDSGAALDHYKKVTTDKSPSLLLTIARDRITALTP
jgi:tetratricopeptide (TPR) repeat protein